MDWPTREDVAEPVMDHGQASRVRALMAADAILALFEQLRADLAALRPVARAAVVWADAAFTRNNRLPLAQAVGDLPPALRARLLEGT